MANRWLTAAKTTGRKPVIHNRIECENQICRHCSHLLLYSHLAAELWEEAIWR